MRFIVGLILIIFSSSSVLALIAHSGDIYINQTINSNNITQNFTTVFYWSFVQDYLYNNTGSLDINETRLNETINNIIAGAGGFTDTQGYNQSDGSINATSQKIGVNISIIQSRVTGTCGAGNSIREIAETGTVTCEADTDTDTNYYTTSITCTNSTTHNCSVNGTVGFPDFDFQFMDLDTDTNYYPTGMNITNSSPHNLTIGRNALSSIWQQFIDIDTYFLTDSNFTSYTNNKKGFVTNTTMNQSRNWSNINNIPPGFADGIDNEGADSTDTNATTECVALGGATAANYLSGAGTCENVCTYGEYTCTFLTAETDPEVNILEENEFCYSTEASVIDCNIPQDDSGNCAPGSVCVGGHEHITTNDLRYPNASFVNGFMMGGQTFTWMSGFIVNWTEALLTAQIDARADNDTWYIIATNYTDLVRAAINLTAGMNLTNPYFNNITLNNSGAYITCNATCCRMVGPSGGLISAC